MKKSVIQIPQMDCASEENLIRIGLEESNISSFEFDFNKRELTILHEEEVHTILNKIKSLGFKNNLISSQEIDVSEISDKNHVANQSFNEKKTLKILLAINAFFFIAEFIIGLLADSTALIADSLDMLADASVYGISLFAVGKTIILKKKAAKLSGILQLLLALSVMAEVIRKYFTGSEPESLLMIIISIFALIANLSCLIILAKHRQGEVHMKASWIFSSNDVMANIGVIAAAILVRVTSSSLPDLAIGFLISIIVFFGAIRILKLSHS